MAQPHLAIADLGRLRWPSPTGRAEKYARHFQLPADPLGRQDRLNYPTIVPSRREQGGPPVPLAGRESGRSIGGSG